MESWKLKMQGAALELRGKIKKAYADLTEDDVTWVDGQEDEWTGKIGQKIGKTKEEVIDWIQKL